METVSLCLDRKYDCCFCLIILLPACLQIADICVFVGGRIVPRFQELTPDKLGKV